MIDFRQVYKVSRLGEPEVPTRVNDTGFIRVLWRFLGRFRENDRGMMEMIQV